MRGIEILGKTYGKVYVKECLGGVPKKYLCICPCGVEFESDSQTIRRERVDCGCGAVTGIHSKLFKVGDVYHGSEILEVGKVYRGQTFYTFKCGKCGGKSGRTHSDFLKRPLCQECLKKDVNLRREEEYRSEYVGNTVNGIHILDIERGGKGTLADVDAICPICGKRFTTSLARIRFGGIGSCGKCAEEGLKAGHKIASAAAVKGTSALCIKPDRALNRNSTTGHKGVSKLSSGRYRAYINFKRKQYFLGNYDTIGDAIEARKLAEKEIYGNFLKWYAETYPEQWEKINGNKTKS